MQGNLWIISYCFALSRSSLEMVKRQSKDMRMMPSIPAVDGRPSPSFWLRSRCPSSQPLPLAKSHVAQDADLALRLSAPGGPAKLQARDFDFEFQTLFLAYCCEGFSEVIKSQAPTYDNCECLFLFVCSCYSSETTRGKKPYRCRRSGTCMHRIIRFKRLSTSRRAFERIETTKEDRQTALGRSSRSNLEMRDRYFNS